MSVLNTPSDSEPAYREVGLARRCRGTKQFDQVSPADFQAIEAVPEFAARWAREAALIYGNDKVLTATVNSSGACPIGARSLCGQYCFAHRSWSPSLSPKRDVVRGYVADARKLLEENKEVGIFMSYDTEPFPGGEVDRISRALLRAMVDLPPAALLIHSHTAAIGGPEVIAILKDLSVKTDVIAGIGFETDSDNVGANRPHHHSVAERFRAFEALSQAGIKTQASTTPLLGFENFRGFVKAFKDAGAYRVMTGELRTEFEGGGTQKAKGIDLGLPVPSQEEAMAVCREFGFPGGVEAREIFYVTMT